MKKKNITPILGQVLKKIAPKIGAIVVLEPEWNIAGQIVFKSGRKRYFRYSTVDLNPVGASDIAKDKDYANFFMKGMGYPTIKGQTFFSKEWAKAIRSKRGIDAAYQFAKKLGFPVIIKPNSGSQGSNVRMAYARKDFYSGMNSIFKKDRVALVQIPVEGKDYRVVVLDKKIISAYLRIPLNVICDGKSTILKLLKKKQREFVKSGRDTYIKADDPRIIAKLKRQGLTLQSIPVKGVQVFLLDNANLSTGGDSVDVTSKIHPLFKKLAIELTKDMGLRICGVDLMIDGLISEAPKKYWILEINAAPGLDHYASTGKAQEKIVEDLYLEVLKSMDLD